MHRLTSVVLPDPDPGFRVVEPAGRYPALADFGRSFGGVT